MHVAIYARASRDADERRVSVDRQVARCTKLAEELFPAREIRTYVDNDLSGADPTVERPAFNAFVAAVRRGEVAGVVVHQQSRLTRRPEQWEQLLVVLTSAGLDKIATVQSGIVAIDEGNRLLSRFKSLLDAEEVERAKVRIKGTHAQLAEEGRPNGGPVYGYEVRGAEALALDPADRGRPALVVNEAEAAVVRRICDELIAGYSLSAIKDGLERDGVPAPGGGTAWHRSTVRCVVAKASVAGLRERHGQVVGPARWPAIVERDRWERARRALAAPAVLDSAGRRRPAVRHLRTKGRRWLLTGGLARCGRCGGPMSVGVETKGSVPVTTYRCHGDLSEGSCGSCSVGPAKVVEDLVVAEVLGRLDNPAMAKRLIEHPDPERAALLAEVHDAEQTMRRAAELKGAGDLDWDTWEALHYPAKARAEGARAALAALHDPDVELPAAQVVHDSWDELTLRQQRAVLERYLEMVVVLPATRLGRPKRGVTAAERIAERLEPTWRA